MSFIQGNINSKEDLIEAMDAMRNMLTHGDPKAELELELAETKHKLAGIKGEVIGGDYYVYYEILRELETNLEPYRDWETDRKSTRLNSSHSAKSRMPSSA